MELNIDALRYDGNQAFEIEKIPTKIADFYEDKADYEVLLNEYRQEIDELQSLMYAHNRYGLLVIMQAMDAAGKDGTIKHVLAGVNPVGVRIESFKRPNETELEHDYLWRHQLVLPERGHITVFNRSYYEEVLVVKVRPQILTTIQRIPAELTKNVDKVWQQRYSDMTHFEAYLHNNGIRVVKIFLNISKQEQGERLIERIEDTTKNWKFDEQDIKERAYWNDYQAAYEAAINATATTKAPWYVVPADDKKNMRLMVAKIITEELKKLDMAYPASTPERQAELQKLIEIIQKQDREV
ncbi:MAG: polyphosphate kinase 2 family protein [Cytophagia bacterium]|nr:MAG: polyphosphate kinase 2 family protein [Cytophagales bacterium]TAG42825.1 MAG: polyphosphate kinase 2 family protein [Cytophagia bacterium]TAG50463.1 MAG: polyphosphate kinase 2 family protein [Runella slithyformis]TAG76362.1 MAG: polyphosphate kinase 2 family protein [Cytophagales bacterium]